MAQGPDQEQRSRGEKREGKRGNELGIWFFKAFLQLFGLRGAYGLLYVVSLHYALFDRLLVASALPYIRRRFAGCGPLKERLHVYRLFVSQGKQLIDRYAAVSGNAVFEIRFKGGNEVVSLIRNSQRGAILLTSHQGNWQVAMTVLEKLEKTVYLVMVPDHNPTMQRELYPDGEGGSVRIISPEQYLGGAIEIINVLRQGNVVSIMGDRGYGASAVEVSFLGDKAWFPYSAFRLAAAAGCPLVVMETAKVSSYSYVVDMSNVLYPQYEGRRDRAGQLQPWVQSFVTLMERFVEEHPYQCFLFRDVWNEEGDGTSV
jgi:predicted LPLAT superfamily acyltransferase